MYPTYCNLSSQHRQVLEDLKGMTGKSLRGVIMEAIEGLAVKYRLAQSPEDIGNRPDWPVNVPRRSRL